MYNVAAMLMCLLLNSDNYTCYRGTVLLSLIVAVNGANAGMSPNPAQSGDIYINTENVTVAAGWTGIVALFKMVKQFCLMALTLHCGTACGGVETIVGVDPIELILSMMLTC